MPDATDPIVRKVLAERLLDDLDQLDVLAQSAGDVDRDELRELAGEAASLAALLLDEPSQV